MSGFKEPILHGLCSLGVSTRALMSTYCGNDASKFSSVKLRFAKPVLPGQTLTVESWETSPGTVVFQTKVKETGKVVINNAIFKYKISSSSSSSSSSGGGKKEGEGQPESAKLFELIEAGVARDGKSIVKKVKGIICFQIKKPDASFVVDLKNGNGSVYAGPPKGKADLTLIVKDKDFVAMSGGKLSAQSAFMTGKLKIKGNMGLAMKLGPILQAARPSKSK